MEKGKHRISKLSVSLYLCLQPSFQLTGTLFWGDFKTPTLRVHGRSEETHWLKLGNSERGKFGQGTRNTTDTLTVLSPLSRENLSKSRILFLEMSTYQVFVYTKDQKKSTKKKKGKVAFLFMYFFYPDTKAYDGIWSK